MDKTKYFRLLDSLSPDLKFVIDFVYTPNNLKLSKLTKESESAEYAAHRFKLNNSNIVFREARITPTKIGQFVTLWKRIAGKPIQPFDFTDSIDFYVINIRKGGNFGQFIFPKSVLYEKNILADAGVGGKRAIRVYPPWDKPLNPQAQKTQKWQSKYFLDLSENIEVDNIRVKMLYTSVRYKN